MGRSWGPEADRIENVHQDFFLKGIRESGEAEEGSQIQVRGRWGPRGGRRMRRPQVGFWGADNCGGDLVLW